MQKNNFIILFFITAVIMPTFLVKAADPNNGATPPEKLFIYSGVYSPYRTYEIRSEISGRVERIWFREGDTLLAGHKLLNLNVSLEKKQLANYQALKKALKTEEALLQETIAIKDKDYKRYEKLFKAGQVSEQALDNKRLALIGAKDSLVKVQKEQIQIENSIAALSDHIRKASFSFDKDLYVSQLFVEQYEQVNPGSLLAKLLDVSKARITLVTPPDLFKMLEDKIKSEPFINVPIRITQDRWQSVKAKIEKVKFDPANDYLYSYSFDLVLAPLEQLLWGEVVMVDLGTIIDRAADEQ